MKIIDEKTGNIIVSDEEHLHLPYPRGCEGTSIYDFYDYYEKGKNGIELIKNNKGFGHADFPTGKFNGYWLLHGYRSSDIPEFKRLERKIKLQKICH